jgi:hypothetical protein
MACSAVRRSPTSVQRDPGGGVRVVSRSCARRPDLFAALAGCLAPRPLGTRRPSEPTDRNLRPSNRDGKLARRNAERQFAACSGGAREGGYAGRDPGVHSPPGSRRVVRADTTGPRSFEAMARRSSAPRHAPRSRTPTRNAGSAPCGCRGCRRGARWVITFALHLGNQRTRRMTACDAHLGTITDAVEHYHYE